jgi:hypothetical protein
MHLAGQNKTPGQIGQRGSATFHVIARCRSGTAPKKPPMRPLTRHVSARFFNVAWRLLPLEFVHRDTVLRKKGSAIGCAAGRPDAGRLPSESIPSGGGNVNGNAARRTVGRDLTAYKFGSEFYSPSPGWFATNLAIRKSTNREMKAPCQKIVAAGAGHGQGATSHPTPSSP